MSTTTSKYHPKSKSSAYRPLAPSVTCGDSSLPEGAMGCVPFHIGLLLWESACCESLSQKSKIFASSLWQGSLWLFPITHLYHLVVEVPAVNLRLTPPPKMQRYPRYAQGIPGVHVFFQGFRPDKHPEIPRVEVESEGRPGRGWAASLPVFPGGCRPG